MQKDAKVIPFKAKTEPALFSQAQIQRMATTFGLKPGGVILDVGCGQGAALATFAPFVGSGGQLFGLDRERTLLEVAKQRFNGRNLAARFFQGEASRLPFGDNSFDLTLAQALMGGLEDPALVLAEMKRVTKPGGCVVLIDTAATGTPEGWQAGPEADLETRLLDHEIGLRIQEGRRKLGLGETRAGYRLPALLQSAGLLRVDALASEKVSLLIPPYTQYGDLAARTRAQLNKDDTRQRRGQEALLRAGGADDALIDRYRIRRDAQRKALVEALDREEPVYAKGHGNWWCSWGFVAPTMDSKDS